VRYVRAAGRGMILGAALFGVVTVISARLAAPAGAAVSVDTVAYHGAMQAYGRLARWAGRRALIAESRYWKAVQQ
jgi:uncharacterized protein YaaW (UPF0174 family)